MMRIPPWRVVEGSKREFCTKAGAEELCRLIISRWREAGHADVKAWPEQVYVQRKKAGSELSHFAVRTNLVAGLPPAMAPTAHQENS